LCSHPVWSRILQEFYTFASFIFGCFKRSTSHLLLLWGDVLFVLMPLYNFLLGAHLFFTCAATTHRISFRRLRYFYVIWTIILTYAYLTAYSTAVQFFSGVISSFLYLKYTRFETDLTLFVFWLLKGFPRKCCNRIFHEYRFPLEY
jgi:hypothetical protein